MLLARAPRCAVAPVSVRVFFEGLMAKQKTGRRPALNRRVVLYDLNDVERAKLKELADKDNRTISRWVADAVRAAMKARD
jgi:hypothetical protein